MTKYALWLDLRTTDDERLHGNGRKLRDEKTIGIQRETEAVGDLTIYQYLIFDAELHFEDGRFVQAAY